MTHPHNLHAQAALWSLRAALRHLTEHREALLIRRPQLGPVVSRPRSLASLQQQDALLLDEKPDRQLLAGSKAGQHPAPGDAPGLLDLERDVNEALIEAHGLLAYTHHRDPVLRWSWHWHDILADWGVTRDARWTWLSMVLPVTRPRLAEAAGLVLAEADQRVRAYTGLDQDLIAPPLAPACPACDRRRLRIRCSAPDSARWTVVCSESCTCIGQACACGMDARERGVRHVWAADSGLAESIRAGVLAVGLAA